MADGVLVCECFIAGNRQSCTNLQLAVEPELHQCAAHDCGQASWQVVANEASLLGALVGTVLLLAAFGTSSRT